MVINWCEQSNDGARDNEDRCCRESWQVGEGGAEPKWTTLLYRSRDTLLHQNGGKTENGAVHVSEFMNWLVMT